MSPRAFRIALVYALLAGLWIFALDLALDFVGGRAFWPGHLLLIVSSVVLLYLVFWRDLRAREQAEARLSDLVDSVVDAIVAIDDEQRIFLFNQGAQKIFGYRPEEVLGQKLDLLLPQRYVASHRSRLDELLLAPEPFFTAGHSGPTVYGRRKDGSEFPAEVSLSRSKLRGRNVFTAILHDISRRRQAEDALQRAHDELEQRVVERTEALTQANAALQAENVERRRAEAVGERERRRAQALARTLQAERDTLHTIMEHTRAHLAYLDSRFNFVLANDTYCRGAGCSREALIGRNHFELFPHPENQAIFERVRDTGQPFEVLAKPFEFPDQPERGVTYWDWTLTPVTGEGGQVQGVVLSLVDVTDTRRMAEALRHARDELELRVEERTVELRASEELFRQLAENVHEVFWVAAADWSQVIYVGPAYEALWGHPPDRLLREPRSFMQAIAPDDQPRVTAQLDKTNADVEFRIMRPDGSTRWARARGFPIRDRAGNIYRIAGITEDITERVEAYQLLEQRVHQRTSELAAANEALQVEVADRLRVEAELEVMLGEHDRQRQQAQDLAALAQFRADELSAVFAAISDPVVALDAQGHVSRINPAAQAAPAALPIDRPIGDEHLPVVYGSDRQLIPWENLPPARALRGETVTAERLLLIGRDGQEISLLASASPLYRGGVLSGAVVVWHYLTEHERLRVLEERQHLARELHDSLTQVLYGISLGAHTARTWLDTNRAKVIEALDYIISLGETGLSEMRALIFDLRPEALEAEGLVKALSKRAAAVQARFELQVITDVCCEPDVPLATKEEVYRIAQEMLHNAVRHAFASRLELKLACDEQGLQLALADNGVGFDPSQTFSGHLGLHSMRERARFLGGSLDIDSAPGQGTRVQLRLPRSREVPVR